MTKPPRKTGKPKALEQVEDDGVTETRVDTIAGQGDDFNAFLRDNFGTTTSDPEVVLVKGEPLASEPPQEKKSEVPSLAWIKAHFKTKSAAIRYLRLELNIPRNTVAELLGVKYQHVRNVETQELKRGPNEDFKLEEGQGWITPKLTDTKS